MLVVEVMMLLKEIELPAWFLPAMTAHELIQLGHNLFPAFLNGCRCIGAYLFVDLDGHQRALLGALHEQNKEVLRALRDIQTSIQNGGGAGPVRPMSVGDAMRNLEAELEGKDIKHPSEVNIFSDGFPSDKKKSNANLYLMIGGYIVLYYIFAGNQASSAAHLSLPTASRGRSVRRGLLTHLRPAPPLRPSCISSSVERRPTPRLHSRPCGWVLPRGAASLRRARR